MLCPICQKSADLIPKPYVYGSALTLAQKIEPSWQPSDGACRHCVESLIDSAAELEDLRTQERPSAIGFREHFRYTLTKREHGQWHHVNPDMARWRQGQIVERVADAAHGAGRDRWLIFDCDEVMLAQGISAGRLI